MIYFDNAATTFPKPEAVWKAMEDCAYHYCGNPGRSGHIFSIKTGKTVFEVRRKLAEILNAEDAMQIVFTCNATEALNLGLKGILREGDHVITTSMEHNSVLRPLKALESKGVESSIVKAGANGAVDPEKIREAIKNNTRLIVCTHASNVCGTIMPIKEIGELAARKGILFFVDASQTMGSIPVDLKEIRADLLAAPGHKGLLGPQGTGFLYLSSDLNGCLVPLRQGGTGTASKSMRQPSEVPEAYESGTLNALGIVGLGAGIEWIERLGGGSYFRGIKAIRSWERELTAYIDDELADMNKVIVYGVKEAEKKVGVTAFNISDLNCEEAASLLSKEYGIAVRAGYHCAGPAHRTIGTWDTGAIRISAGPFNTKKEANRLLQAVYRMTR